MYISQYSVFIYILLYIYICIYLYIIIRKLCVCVYIWYPPPGTYLSLIYTVNYSIICLFSYVDRFIPRFPRFPRKVFWKSWILDLGCIQDFQPASKKKFLGILDLGSWVHPRFCKCIQEKFSGNLGSWILGASKILQVHPRKVFWKSWILDLGFIPRFPRKAFWKSWILDLG